MSDDGTAGPTSTDHASSSQTTGTPPGWYADPQGAMRWWDGAAWTGHVAPGAAAVTRTATILSTADPATASGSPVASRLPNVPGLQAMPQLSRRTWLAVGAVGVVLLLLAGYLLFGRGDDEAPAAGTVVHHATAQEVVKQVALSTHDLRDGLRVSVTPDSVLATQHDDLLCGHSDPSAPHQVAERDVTVVTANGQQTGIENDVVAYDSATAAHAELVALRSTLGQCPHGYVRLNPRSKDLVLFTNIRTAPLGASHVPGGAFDEALILTFTVAMKQPRVSVHDMVMVVRRGSVVSSVALVSPVAITPQMVQTVQTLSNVTVRRLPAS